eukprot:635882_1
MSYIMQDDCLFETLTPAESLRFSANLRLPSFISAEEKELRVQRILKGLDLSAARIPSPAVITSGGLSGGERKRLSIGGDPISHPSLLFVDGAQVPLPDGYARVRGLRRREHLRQVPRHGARRRRGGGHVRESGGLH